MNKEIFRRLVLQLRGIRSCPVELIMFYRTRFEGYCQALFDLDLVDLEVYQRLTHLGLNASFLLSRRRTLKRDDSSAVSSAVEVVQDDSATEQVSVPAASAELPVFIVRGRTLFYTLVHKLHPRKWCPFDIDMAFARGELPSGWPPLPGKRSLVGGEGEVCLPSVQEAGSLLAR